MHYIICDKTSIFYLVCASYISVFAFDEKSLTYYVVGMYKKKIGILYDFFDYNSLKYSFSFL